MGVIFSSREFNQDASRAKRASNDAPVIITDRGRPSHVLMTMETYERLRASDARQPLVGFLEGLGLDGLDVMRDRDTGREIAL